MPLAEIAGLVAGAKALGLGGAAYAGYQGAAYAYSSVRDWIDPSRVEKRNHEALAHLMKTKEEKEAARMQNLDSVVADIQQRKDALAGKAIDQQADFQDVVKTIEQDSRLIHGETLQLAERFSAVNEASQSQEEVIAALKQELQVKMDALDAVQRQLSESNARFEEARRELIHANEQTAASKEELAQVKKVLTGIAQDNDEKESQIAQLDKKIGVMALQLEAGDLKFKKATAKIDELTSEVASCNQLIDTLTEQLEEAQVNRKPRSPSPTFFR